MEAKASRRRTRRRRTNARSRVFLWLAAEMLSTSLGTATTSRTVHNETISMVLRADEVCDRIKLDIRGPATGPRILRHMNR